MRLISSFDMNDSGYGFWVYANSNGTNQVWTTTNYCDNNWHYLVYLRESGVIKLYVDTILKDSKSYAGSVDLSSLNYTFSGQPGYYFFKGLIDDVRIFNASMSTSQVREQYYIGLNTLFKSSQIALVFLAEIRPDMAAAGFLALPAPRGDAGFRFG